MTENIIINEFILKVNSLNNEKEKSEFIVNYNNFKDEFNKIDEILNKESEIDEKLTIPELLNMIKEYDNENDNKSIENIDVKSFKKLNDLIELINNKINDENIEINEIK